MFHQCMQAIIKLKQEIWLMPHKRRSEKLRAHYLQTHAGEIKLNIGCGPSLIEGWLNCDIHLHPGSMFLDATQPFPLPDASVRYIRCEHFIEHLDYAQGEFFLRECRRVLKDGGVLRLITPDLRALYRLYEGKGPVSTAELLAHHRQHHHASQQSICGWFNDHVRMWGHQFIYDEPTLLASIEKAGFSRIEHHHFGESSHAALRDIDVHDEGVEWMKSAYVVILEAVR